MLGFGFGSGFGSAEKLRVSGSPYPSPTNPTPSPHPNQVTPALKRVVLLSKMGVTRVTQRPLGLNKGDVEQARLRVRSRVRLRLRVRVRVRDRARLGLGLGLGSGIGLARIGLASEGDGLLRGFELGECVFEERLVCLVQGRVRDRVRV